MAKSGRLELGENTHGYYKSIFNQRDVFGEQSNRFREKCKKRLLHCSRSFKVIEVGTNQKPVCDFLLVINSNWQPISYRCRVIAAYCSNYGHFALWSHPLGGLGTMYDVHLGLTGKRVLDFLLVIIELFLLDVTAEVLWVRRFRSSTSVWRKISGRRGRPPPIIFAWIVRPMNALQLCC